MKRKINLTALKVESFVTNMSKEAEVNTVKGGVNRGPNTIGKNCTTIGIPCNTDQDITKMTCTVKVLECGF